MSGAEASPERSGGVDALRDPGGDRARSTPPPRHCCRCTAAIFDGQPYAAWSARGFELLCITCLDDLSEEAV